jgi:hypothetical protein
MSSKLKILPSARSPSTTSTYIASTDQSSIVKYFQPNMNNLTPWAAHCEAVRGLVSRRTTNALPQPATSLSCASGPRVVPGFGGSAAAAGAGAAWWGSAGVMGGAQRSPGPGTEDVVPGFGGGGGGGSGSNEVPGFGGGGVVSGPKGHQNGLSMLSSMDGQGSRVHVAGRKVIIGLISGVGEMVEVGEAWVVVDATAVGGAREDLDVVWTRWTQWGWAILSCLHSITFCRSRIHFFLGAHPTKGKPCIYYSFYRAV